MEWTTLPAEKLGHGSPIGFGIVDTEVDLYWHIALDMVERIRANNAAGSPTVFIVPVGPIGQYRRFVDLCNHDRIDLSQVHFINMDEYLDDEGRPIGTDSPLSFRGFMDRECYSRLDPSIAMPVANRIFPTPGKEAGIQATIDRLGGVDTTYGGIGINGHIAFNEPPEPDTEGRLPTIEDFAATGTRILELSRETRTINAVTAAGGCIDLIPRLCITVGMREILGARRLRLFMHREWQKGMVRKVLHGGLDVRVPASLCALHPDARLTVTTTVAVPPLGSLR